MGEKFVSLVELGRYRAQYQGDKIAYHMLKDGSELAGQLTYRELDEKARALGAELQQGNFTEKRALLLFHSGLDFVVAFLGCLYAGVTAVPVPFPGRKEKDWKKLSIIAEDAGVGVVLTVSEHGAFIREYLREYNYLNTCGCLETDTVDSDLAARWRDPAANEETLAFLQYTSGSTGIPKGVMVSHGNLLHNQEMMRKAYRHSSETIIVSWLPLYHDMGLIGNVLHTLYLGGSCYLMTPVAFLQQPLRWLQAMSDYKAHSSFAPNFAYQLCLRRVSETQRDKLDLSHWRMALNGAEPVRADTLEKFSEFFVPAGFCATAAFPAYGLAEATLFVSGSDMDLDPIVVTVESKALQNHSVIYSKAKQGTQRLVSSGLVNTDQKIAIVNPDSFEVCGARQVGEIWIHGPSVAGGYWNKPEQTRETFCAEIKVSNGEPDSSENYLRTGDLGFIDSGRLYITGRIKDMIVVNGANYYPQDIEKALQETHPSLRDGYGAVFGVEHQGSEQVVVVQEVERTHLKKINSEDVFNHIRNVVGQQFQIPVAAIVLIRPMTLPLTSSGKIQRRRSRTLFFEKGLGEVACWYGSEAMCDQVEGAQSKRQADTDRLKNTSDLEANASRASGEALINWLRDFGLRFVNSRLIDERRCIPPHILANLAAQGLLGMCVPSEYNGLGMRHIDVFRVLTQLAAIDTNIAAMVSVHHALGTRPILNYGTEALKQRYLPALAQGTMLGAFAITEPGAGSNPRAMTTVARPAARGGWLVNGEKSWIGNGAWAGVINCFVQLQDANGKNLGITAFAVEQGRTGLIMGEEAPTMGMRGMVQNQIHFRDMHVTTADMLGEAGMGMDVAQDAMMYGRLVIAAMSLGAMKRCFQIMTEYAAKRPIIDGLLLNNAVTLQRLSDIRGATLATEAMVETLALLQEQEKQTNSKIIPIEIYAAVKVFAPEYCWQAVDQLMQMLGGRGYTENNIAPRLLRDTRLFRIFEGPTEALTAFLGARVANDSPQLQRFFTEHLQSESELKSLTDRGAALSQELRRILETSDYPLSEVQAERWLKSSMGELATLSIVKAFLVNARQRGLEYSEDDLRLAGDWLQKEIDSKRFAISQNLKHSKSWYNAETCKAQLAELAGDIGYPDQAAADMETEPDPLLLMVPQAMAVADPGSVFEGEPATDNKIVVGVNINPEARHRDLIESYIIDWLSVNVNSGIAGIEPHMQFVDVGVESVLAVELAFALQEKLGFKVDSTVVWNYPTIAELAAFLSNENLLKSESTASAAVAEAVIGTQELSDDEILSALSAEIADD